MRQANATDSSVGWLIHRQSRSSKKWGGTSEYEHVSRNSLCIVETFSESQPSPMQDGAVAWKHWQQWKWVPLSKNGSQHCAALSCRAATLGALPEDVAQPSCLPDPTAAFGAGGSKTGQGEGRMGAGRLWEGWIHWQCALQIPPSVASLHPWTWAS